MVEHAESPTDFASRGVPRIVSPLSREFRAEIERSRAKNTSDADSFLSDDQPVALQEIVPGINLGLEVATRTDNGRAPNEIALLAFSIDIDEGPDETEDGQLGLRDFILGIANADGSDQDVEIND